jgi:predicted phage terminase large subunit-like protein
VRARCGPYDLIARLRTGHAPTHRRTAAISWLAVDPAATNKKTSDETGIVIAGTDANGNGYVLQDVSLKASPAGWAQAAIQAYHRWQANVIVVETNNGGDMVEHTIHSVENVPVKQVRASRGKHTRAEPIAALYENGRIFHAGTFHDLEDQLTTWTPGDDSPDRLDALVWAMTELMITGGEIQQAGYRTIPDIYGR